MDARKGNIYEILNGNKQFLIVGSIVNTYDINALCEERIQEAVYCI